MLFKSRLILRTLLCLFFCSCAMARSQQQKSKEQKSKIVANSQIADPGKATQVDKNIEDPSQAPPLSGLFNISRSTSLYDFKDGTRKDGLDYELRAGYALSKEYSLGLISGYSQNLKDSVENDFTNTSVSIKRAPGPWGGFVLGGYGFGVNLPTSKKSSQGQSLNFGTTGSLAMQINPEKLSPGWEISSSISLTKNFHSYQTAQDGSVNNSWSSLQLLGIQYSQPLNFGFSLTVIHRNSLSYQDVLKDSFEFTEEIFYKINQELTVSVGHTNAGSSLKPNANDSNVQIFDEKNSLVYLGLTVGF